LSYILTNYLPVQETKPTLLLVDDEPATLHIMKQILQDHYHLLFAKDGMEALRVAQEQIPELILLDVNIPKMNGYQVCKSLKADSRTLSIPVIFISAMGQVDDETKGFEVGAVDYITKPVSAPIVKARVSTHIALVKELQKSQLAEKNLRSVNEELNAYKQFSEYELGMARDLMEHMLEKSSLRLSNVQTWIKPATNLCGDMIITQSHQGRQSYILLADAMGHGLPAALPLLPIVQVFSSLAKDGFTLSSIIQEMNDRIVDLIPIGNFIAVTLLCIDHANSTVEIWNGGNPPPRIYDSNGKTLQIFPSIHHALGMDRDRNFIPVTEVFQWKNSCWLTIYSDGLLEALNANEDQFGENKIIENLRGEQPHNTLIEAVLHHLGEAEAHDDISVATVLLKSDL
jgi:DNA-binding response OmpR family regulator